MKVVLRSSSLPLTLVGILMNVGVARVDTGLRRGVVGRLRTGMSMEEAKAELAVNPGAEHDVAVEFADGLLVKCQVLSRRFRTTEGIGVGSSGADLDRAYGVVWEKPGVAFVPQLQMRFTVEEGKVAKILVS